MIQIIDKKQCCGCASCVNICPQKCIHMEIDDEGFKYPIINEAKCNNCGLCEKNCPFNNEYNVSKDLTAFAAKANDLNVRKNSSSGGIFSLVATRIIQQDGVVFGATFSKDFSEVYHIGIENVDYLNRLQGSKYIQSDIRDSYQQVKSYLKKGKTVLFSGTPCQIAGLKMFLRKDYVNLITIEVICHGVPSPLFWKKYVMELEKQNTSKISGINFRSKKEGWKKFGLEEFYQNGKIKYANLSNNFYLRVFLSNFCLRPSCYKCKTRCIADIILGDLWGSKEIIPEIDDDTGISLVIINTEKGKNIIADIQSDAEFYNVDLSRAVKYNPSLYSSVKEPYQRKNFFNDLKRLSFQKLERKYCKLLDKKKRKNLINTIIYYIKYICLRLIKKCI